MKEELPAIVDAVTVSTYSLFTTKGAGTRSDTGSLMVAGEYLTGSCVKVSFVPFSWTSIV